MEPRINMEVLRDASTVEVTHIHKVAVTLTSVVRIVFNYVSTRYIYYLHVSMLFSFLIFSANTTASLAR